eukprot:TRINITY_DN1261_c0_g2_i1.p1 TRINITY_DN1261_c0_g2~~TRINITY_DN1261_c0_g2_i1.p1  ORF type:complete len:536 (-),score=138.10 TRINITY_DN1261_c0_g2_i1:350-1957(-)
MALTVARGMEKLGLAAEQEYNGRKLRTIGIFSKNRLEWIVTDIGCWMSSVTSISLYDMLGEDGICYIADQTQFSTIFVSAEGILKTIELHKKGKLPMLKNLVCFDEMPADAKDKTSLTLIKYQDIVELGRKETEVALKDSEPEDMMTVCYTSGSTGIPKGIIIAHGRFRDNTSALYQAIVPGKLGPGTTLISYLPLSHLYERIMVNLIIMSGFREGFFHGVINELQDDMKECKPHFFSGVPRILCRFYESIMKDINSLTGFKKKLALTATKAKMDYYKKTGEVFHWLYDRLVFDKIRDAFGGELRIFLSSSAPLDAAITDHLKIFLCAYYTQVYGQTELNAPLTMSYIEDTDSSSSGPPICRYKLKLVDVPEMGYYTTDVINGIPTPRGELCAKGPMSPGYFKDPEKTAELIDSEGWLHTADIALFTPNGCVKIIDRKKNIFKLQQGEFVAPEKIENILSFSPWVQQILVYGDSYRNYIVALIVPQEQTVLKWIKDNNVQGAYEEVCRSEELNRAILRDLAALSREKKVRARVIE